MTAKVFLDTNLWIYFFTKKPYDKALAVAEVIANYSDDSSLLVSTQVLGEIYHVLTRKTSYSKQECQAMIQDLDRAFSPIVPIDPATVLEALEINDRYSFSYWDSLILATALLNDCETLYSEDMQHKMVIFDHLQIRNPFTVNP
ncbi:MAG: PIN domain-containing protein [Plectolyngbya sp. WJT66-NPBG17]|jgi:predicted nucleic acid-binding protein|nr:PIN domain-containing protein [Plectolyngbya sp. WJT66-NPBG17]